MSVVALPAQKAHPVSTFLELTKLRISGASTFTAAAGYVAFLRGANAGLITTLLGILLLAMGSSALNEVQEHKYDALMPRTAHRPIPRGDLSPAMAAVIATLMAVSGFLLLLWAHNLTSALLGALALAWAFTSSLALRASTVSARSTRVSSISLRIRSASVESVSLIAVLPRAGY